MVERRRSQRVHYCCKVRIEHPQFDQQVVTCRDISETGLYVFIPKCVFPECDNSIIGSMLQLHVITALPQPRSHLTKIVRSDTDGIGLKFIA